MTQNVHAISCVVSLKIINDAYACLEFLCAATERFSQCSAEHDRNFSKMLRNAGSYHMAQSIAILKIDARFCISC